MAKRAMMYCRLCRRANPEQLSKEELYLEMPENNVFRCKNGHAYNTREELDGCELIKFEYIETPPKEYEKESFFVDPLIMKQFRAMYPNRVHSSINSILGIFVKGEPVIIDGQQAKRLKELGVRNGAEMIAALEVTKSLEAEIEGLKGQVNMLGNILSQSGKAVEG
jgi:hypothetical protein